MIFASFIKIIKKKIIEKKVKITVGPHYNPSTRNLPVDATSF